MKKGLIGFLLVLGVSSVQAQGYDDPLMAEMGKQFKPIIKMLKGKRPVNMDEVRFRAMNLAQLARELGDHRWARPQTVTLIRKNPSKYWQLARNYVHLADAFVKVAHKSTDFKAVVPALKRLALNCKACHKSFKPTR